MALADTVNLIVALRLDDKFSGPMSRAQGVLGRFGGGLGQTGKGVGQLAAGLGRVGVVAAGVAAGGFAAVAKAAGNFEAQLNTINTIAKLNEQDLKGVGEGIRQVFRETGQPLDDLTNGYYDLLSAGIKVKDAQNVLNQSVKLGIGGLGTTSEAVDLLTTAINAYGLDAAGSAHATDVFAQAVADGKVRISEISSTFASVAPTAKQFGVSIDEIGAAYGFLTARGVPAAEVTTQMNRAILDLVKPSKDAKKVLKELGTTGEELIRKEGLVGALQTLRDRAEDLGIPMQNLFGRIEGYKFALQTTGASQKGFNAELAKMGKAAGTSTAQFEERQKGLNFQLGRLKALAHDAGITIGNALLPKLVPLIEKLNTFITENQGKIAQFGEDLADAFGNFADKVQETDFSGLVEGLKIVASVGQKVVDIFLKLPPGLQAVIIGGAAINKISGGLVGAGLGNIIGGGIKLLFERGSPTNPMYVVPIGGGLGGPGAAAGGLGLAGTALLTGGAVATTGGGLLALDELKRAIAEGSEEGIKEGVLDFTGGFPGLIGKFVQDTFFPTGPKPTSPQSSTPLGQFDPRNLGGTGGVPVKVTNPKDIVSGGLGNEGERILRDGFANLTLEQRLLRDPKFKPKLDEAAFIRILRRTSEFGAAGRGTSIERGPRTGRDPFGEAFLALVKRVKVLTPEVMREVGNHIVAAEQVQARLLKAGDIAGARRIQRTIDALHKIQGTQDRTNAILDTLKSQTHSALSVANRNLATNNAKQQRIVSGIDAARERIGSGFAASNAQLGVIARKETSFTANVITNVTAHLSTYQALTTLTRVSRIRAGTGFTPRLLNG